MADLALSTVDFDVLIENDAMEIVDGDDAIVQHLKLRLQFFFAEWFLDKRLGVPYIQQILVKNPNLGAVRNIIREVVLETPGIASIDRFDLSVDAIIRKLTVGVTAVKDDGEILDFTGEFIIG